MCPASRRHAEILKVSKIPSDRILKLGISLFVFGFDAVRNVVLQLFGVRRQGYCVVLYYHAVPNKHRSEFSRQMDMLLRCAKPVASNYTETCSPGERCVAVTFDDGLESVIENALPELERRSIPSTIFVVPESLGKFPIWMAGPSPSNNPGRVMSLGQLRNLRGSLVTVGSHSLTHPNLSKIAIAEAREQIFRSRALLTEMLGKEVLLFSFPYGAFNQELVSCCREAGYERVFTSLPILALTKPDEFVLGRVGVEPTDWPIEFRLKLAGAYRWLPAAIEMKRRMRIRWTLGAAAELPTQ